MNHLLSIHELSLLLAKHILADNFLTEEKIATKCKVFLLSWHRVNNISKKGIVLNKLQVDGIKYTIARKAYEQIIYDNLGEKGKKEIERIREVLDLIS